MKKITITLIAIAVFAFGFTVGKQQQQSSFDTYMAKVKTTYTMVAGSMYRSPDRSEIVTIIDSCTLQVRKGYTNGK